MISGSGRDHELWSRAKVAKFGDNLTEIFCLDIGLENLHKDRKLFIIHCIMRNK